VTASRRHRTRTVTAAPLLAITVFGSVAEPVEAVNSTLFASRKLRTNSPRIAKLTLWGEIVQALGSL